MSGMPRNALLGGGVTGRGTGRRLGVLAGDAPELEEEVELLLEELVLELEEDVELLDDDVELLLDDDEVELLELLLELDMPGSVPSICCAKATTLARSVEFRVKLL